LTYDGFEAGVPISGEAHNDNVYLSKNQVISDPTSITLFSHQYYKIHNKSSVPIEFSWRAFATDAEEKEKKERLIAQLTQEENEELREIEAKFGQGMSDEDEGSLDSDDSYNETEMKNKDVRRKAKALSTLSRKYQAIKKAVVDDKMLFQDEIFQIEP
jgi:hydrocephalus-inducing protein